MCVCITLSSLRSMPALWLLLASGLIEFFLTTRLFYIVHMCGASLFPPVSGLQTSYMMERPIHSIANRHDNLLEEKSQEGYTALHKELFSFPLCMFRRFLTFSLSPFPSLYVFPVFQCILVGNYKRFYVRGNGNVSPFPVKVNFPV